MPTWTKKFAYPFMPGHVWKTGEAIQAGQIVGIADDNRLYRCPQEGIPHAIATKGFPAGASVVDGRDLLQSTAKMTFTVVPGSEVQHGDMESEVSHQPVFRDAGP